MVILAISTAGLQDALRLAEGRDANVWCGADAISEAEYAALKNSRLSRFIYPLQGQEPDVLAGAIDTVEEHHPGETLWIEKNAPEL
ncbi:MAG: hypothetical protein A3F76_13155 [Burkholderiales bacterium RIFCSPLOWO2_12_FULL_65_40]|nr:MAG: hypothetical protein A3F76_13155 [Burkholderiales bacterium RIFCSPLOWO2_12_FULL_65_40]